MEALSKDEFRSVLAHEFAHLSRHHGRSSQWIYRLRRSWEPVFAHLSRPRMPNEISLRPLIRKFLNWHWPRFNAHAFVLSRAHEYLADAEAARVVGPPTSAAALMRLDVCADALDNTIWPEIWKQTATVPVPPEGVFQRIRNSFAQLLSDPSAHVQRVLLETTTNADTHPCLSDRLRAISQLPADSSKVDLPSTISSAAEDLLGPALSRIRDDVEKQWQKDAHENWTQRHSKANALSDRLQTIDHATASRANDTGALWDKACVVAQLQGEEAAMPLLKQVLELDPAHALANFSLGRVLLKKSDSQGECYLERAIAADQELLPDAGDRLHQFYRQTGQAEKIRALYARLDQFEKVMAESRTERSNVTAKDTFVAHGLSESQIRAVCNVLSSEADIVEAHLAQKQMKHLIHQRLYVLAVRVRTSWHRLPNEERQQACVARISKIIEVPGRILIIPSSGPFGALARKIRKVTEARIFVR
ncbi:MAG: htpX 1 [Verrucomicrobiales bacterium]|nr:htpX 1 [Verrucomicrobiales bacterium]